MSELTPRQIEMLAEFEAKEDREIIKAFEIENDDWFVVTGKGREMVGESA